MRKNHPIIREIFHYESRGKRTNHNVINFVRGSHHNHHQLYQTGWEQIPALLSDPLQQCPSPWQHLRRSFQVATSLQKKINRFLLQFPPLRFHGQQRESTGPHSRYVCPVVSFFCRSVLPQRGILYFFLLYLYIEFMNVVFNQTCCLGCGGLKYLPEKNPDDLIRDQLSTDPKVLTAWNYYCLLYYIPYY